MSKNVTEEQVDQAIAQMGQDLQVNPDPEAIAKLREQYGVTFDITGQLVEVKTPRKLRKAVKAELESGETEREQKAKKLAQSITAGASKTGEVVMYGLVDAPVEGAKTAKVVTQAAARNARQRFQANHARRIAAAQERKLAREQRKAAREAAKAAQESQDQPES